MRDPHDRRCFQCGHIQHCIDRVIPEVTCRNCGSNDTRAIVPKITCGHCSGTGMIALAGAYAETLRSVLRKCARSGECIVANRDWKLLGAPSGTALSNRLSRLEEMGFLRSETIGRQRRFYPCDTKGEGNGL